MQLQPDARMAGLIPACSQCAAILGPQYPLSCSLCSRCSVRWNNRYRLSRVTTVRNNHRGDCGEGPPMKIPALSIPVTTRPAEETPTFEGSNWVDLSTLLASISSEELDNNEGTPENFELAYPDEHPPIGVPVPTEAHLPVTSRTSQSISQPQTTPVDPEVASPKDIRSIEPPQALLPVDPPLRLPPLPSRIKAPSNQRTPGVTGKPSLPPLWSSQALLLPNKPTSGLFPPVIDDHLRVCATRGCTAALSPDSTSSRCVNCVKAEWKARRAKKLSPLELSKGKGKGKGKSVTWADQQFQVNQCISTYDRPALDPSNGWISRIKRVRLKLSESRNIGPASGDSPPTKEDDPKIKRADLGHSIPNKEGISDKDGKRSVCEPLGGSLLGESDTGDLSELTDTSSEESDPGREGSTDETRSDPGSEPPPKPPKLTIRIPARRSVRASSPKPPYAQCATRHCQRYLPPNHSRDVCTWCHVDQKWRALREEANAQGSTSPQSSSRAKDLTFTHPSVTDLINRELLSRGVVPGARICTRTSCHQIIPAQSEYPPNTCSPCRIKLSRPQGTDSSTIAASEISYTEIPNDALAKDNTDPPPPRGRCKNRDCGVIVDGSSECWQCTNRRLGHRTQRGETRGCGSAADSEKAPAVPMRSSGEVPSCLKKESSRPPPIITPYPEYRSQQDLLADFYLKITGFLEPQSIHELYSMDGPQNKVVFGFDGQFSVVTLDFDLMGRRGLIEMGVLKLKGEMGRLGALYFDPARSVTVNGSGIFTRFMCVYRICSTLAPPLAQEAKLMQGELEIAVLPDRSHRFIPGQKTVVRFCMVG